MAQLPAYMEAAFTCVGSNHKLAGGVGAAVLIHPQAIIDGQHAARGEKYPVTAIGHAQQSGLWFIRRHNFNIRSKVKTNSYSDIFLRLRLRQQRIFTAQFHAIGA